MLRSFVLYVFSHTIFYPFTCIFQVILKCQNVLLLQPLISSSPYPTTALICFHINSSIRMAAIMRFSELYLSCRVLSLSWQPVYYLFIFFFCYSTWLNLAQVLHEGYLLSPFFPPTKCWEVHEAFFLNARCDWWAFDWNRERDTFITVCRGASC